jgi:hypothetical protein
MKKKLHYVISSFKPYLGARSLLIISVFNGPLKDYFITFLTLNTECKCYYSKINKYKINRYYG